MSAPYDSLPQDVRLTDQSTNRQFYQARTLMQVVPLRMQVLSVLPADPQAQLELAHRIVAHAFSQKVGTHK